MPVLVSVPPTIRPPLLTWTKPPEVASIVPLMLLTVRAYAEQPTAGGLHRPGVGHCVGCQGKRLAVDVGIDQALVDQGRVDPSPLMVCPAPWVSMPLLLVLSCP